MLGESTNETSNTSVFSNSDKGEHRASAVCIEREMTAFEMKQEREHLDQLQSQGPEYLRILR